MLSSLALVALLQSQPLELTEENYNRLRTQIQLSPKEEGVRAIGWTTSLMDGPEAAIKVAAPIALWLGDGHPLAGTSSFGVVLRAKFFAEPGVRNLMQSFCPVAEDYKAINPDKTWVSEDTAEKLKKDKAGLYVISAGGAILSFTQSTDVNELVSTLQKGLTAWGQTPATGRSWAEMKKRVAGMKPPATTAPAAPQPGRPNRVTTTNPDGSVTITVQGSQLPAPPGRRRPGGTITVTPTPAADPLANKLQLKFICRDLPRENGSPGSAEYNYYAIELQTREGVILPRELRPNQTVDWPDNIAKYVLGNAFVDRVRGHGMSFQPGDLQKSRMRTEITNVAGDIITVRVLGALNAAAEGRWALQPGQQPPADGLQVRGVDLQIRGNGRYNQRTKRWISFDLVAVGTRWGGAPENRRADDLKPNPIGFFATLPESSFWDRVLDRPR